MLRWTWGKHLVCSRESYLPSVFALYLFSQLEGLMYVWSTLQKIIVVYQGLSQVWSADSNGDGLYVPSSSWTEQAGDNPTNWPAHWPASHQLLTWPEQMLPCCRTLGHPSRGCSHYHLISPGLLPFWSSCTLGTPIHSRIQKFQWV